MLLENATGICGQHDRRLEGYLERYGRSLAGKSAIARDLKISRAALYRKLTELGLLKK